MRYLPGLTFDHDAYFNVPPHRFCQSKGAGEWIKSRCWTSPEGLSQGDGVTSSPRVGPFRYDANQSVYHLSSNLLSFGNAFLASCSTAAFKMYALHEPYFPKGVDWVVLYSVRSRGRRRRTRGRCHPYRLCISCSRRGHFSTNTNGI